jgi:GNAT superfamily N-acetyltransferase
MVRQGQGLGEFKTVFFDEIDDPYQVTMLLQLSLFFPATPELLWEIRANDDRYTPEFGIFAVTSNGTVAGGHLLMRIRTDTIEGGLEVGGVNAVATRPDFARRGVMTAVMNKTHEYFIERDLEYSFLATSARHVAAMMYEKLGYKELDRSRVAVKYPEHPRAQPASDISVRSFSEVDVPIIDRIFRTAVAGSYGFIRRPNNFLRARNYTQNNEIRPTEKLRIAQRDGQPTGYAYWEGSARITEAYEILAFDRPSFQALLVDVETRTPNSIIWVWCGGLTNLELGWLKDAGYQVPIESYKRAVIKKLRGEVDPRGVKMLYGVDQGKFRLGIWDET